MCVHVCVLNCVYVYMRVCNPYACIYVWLSFSPGKSSYQHFLDIVLGAPDDLPAALALEAPDALRKKQELRAELKKQADEAVKVSAKLLREQVCACVDIHTYIQTDRQTDIHTYIHACILARLYTQSIHEYIHSHILAHLHACMHAYIHTYTRT